MRRRWAALICCLALVLQLAAPAAAVETVCFTAVNETVLELDDSTMPFWSGGYLYAPSTVFRDLGVSHSKNLLKGLVMMYGQSRHLLFDLNQGTVTTEKGESRSPAAIRRGNVVFLPVAMMAETFGLHYSAPQRVSHGYLVRLTNSAAVLNDATFYDAVPSVLEERYHTYVKNRTPDTGTTQPQTPSQDIVSGKQIHLCMSAADMGEVPALLDALDSYSGQAAFYLTAEQMAENGDLLRRMTVSGHAVGILADGSRTDLTAAEQISRANDALWKATCGKTRLVQLENGTDQLAAELGEMGYALLAPDLDRSGYGLWTASGASALLNRVNARRGAVTVWLAASVGTTGLRAFLKAAWEAEDHCLAVTETVS